MGVLIVGWGAGAEPDLAVVPMFHANAWAWRMPRWRWRGPGDAGPGMAPAALAELIESERVSVAAGVPTIWMGVLPS